MVERQTCSEIEVKWIHSPIETYGIIQFFDLPLALEGLATTGPFFVGVGTTTTSSSSLFSSTSNIAIEEAVLECLDFFFNAFPCLFF